MFAQKSYVQLTPQSSFFLVAEMVSQVDRAKRALVTLLKQLAAAYSAVLTLTRDSSDAAVRTAYVCSKTVSMISAPC